MKMLFKLAFATAIVVTSAAYAQQPQSLPKEFTIKVDAKGIELIGKGLGKLTYEEAAPLMESLKFQINEQIIIANKTNPAPLPTKPKE